MNQLIRQITTEIHVPANLRQEVRDRNPRAGFSFRSSEPIQVAWPFESKYGHYILMQTWYQKGVIRDDSKELIAFAESLKDTPPTSEKWFVLKCKLTP